jgi:A/G-specific adenine glycosylase
VRRVLSRAVLGVAQAPDADVWRAADAIVPENAAAWNHALMDIGALFCRATPDCDACPLRRTCAFKRGRAKEHTLKHIGNPPSARATRRSMPCSQPYEGSRRQHRGRVIRALASVRDMNVARLGAQVKEGFGKSDLPWLYALLAGLERDGLIALNERRTRAAIA